MKVLIVSNGPVPPMTHAKIEGGGQRCWGLATGLDKNGFDVTVAVRDTYPLNGASHPSIKMARWSPGKQLTRLAGRFDVVVISYSMGRLAADLARAVKDSAVFVLDCYVPIYVEISARGAKDLKRDYPNYLVDLGYFNKALKRGDYFLYANQPQKHFYTGVLSALGLINPYSYGQQRLLPVPFGIDSGEPAASRNPYPELGVKKDDFVLLWFGGLYPWYDITPLLAVVKKTTNLHLVIVGGKSPYNRNPEFTAPYDAATSYIQNNKLSGKIHLVDWVDFNERINWYAHADAAISISNPGEENIYSWRTRIMDHVWGQVPLITNGGDPLCELLLAQNAAVRLPSLDEKDIAATLQKLKDSPDILKTARQNLAAIRDDFYWHKVVEPLAEALAQNQHPYRQERKFAASIGFNPLKTRLSRSKAGKAALLPMRAARKLRTDGIKGAVASAKRRLSSK